SLPAGPHHPQCPAVVIRKRRTEGDGDRKGVFAVAEGFPITATGQDRRTAEFWRPARAHPPVARIPEPGFADIPSPWAWSLRPPICVRARPRRDSARAVSAPAPGQSRWAHVFFAAVAAGARVPRRESARPGRAGRASTREAPPPLVRG